jgi:hypothetical protein
MKNNRKSLDLVLLFASLLPLMAACGSGPKFVAPQIDPPADLVPAYVPEGFELITGFQIKMDGVEARPFTRDDDVRVICDKDLSRSFFDLKSPAGSDLLGVYYQSKDRLLLISKSYFPGGTLDLWQTIYESSDGDHGDCDCLQLAVAAAPIPFRGAEIQEVRTIGETRVAILEKAGGLITVFMRGDDLIAVEGDLPLDEHLRIVESLIG